MKKIIGAALLGTMAAGVFAADAKINLNYRSRLEAFAQDTIDDGTDKKTTREWMDWQDAGYSAASTDNMSFTLNGERAGAKLTVVVNNNVSNKSGSSIENTGGFFQLNEFSGWMNFPIGPGTLTLRTGNWKDGYADGNYRVKKDVDAMNAEALDFERFKLGAILNGSKGLKFADDLTSGKGQTATSGFADYDFKLSDDMSLNFLVGGTHVKDFDEVVDGDTTTKWMSSFSSRIQFNMKNAVNAELIYKNAHSADTPLVHTFALYVMPQIMKELTLNIGGAMEVYSGTKDDKTGEKDDYMDWAVDLRARYQVMDPLSITFYTNISGTNLDAGRQISSGIAGTDGSKGWTRAKIPDEDGKAGQYTAKFKTAMWNQLGLRYVVNDTIAATLNVGLITPLAKGDGNDFSYAPEWRVVPGVQVFADKNASIWTAAVFSGASVEDYSVFNFSVPVIFRVKM